jgi:phosphoglycolate phosphatase-like HAD superfamily hydrolase
VYAAAKLGIPCIGLTCGGISASELTDAGAVAVYTDPASMHAHLDDLPPAAASRLR